MIFNQVTLARAPLDSFSFGFVNRILGLKESPHTTRCGGWDFNPACWAEIPVVGSGMCDRSSNSSLAAAEV